MDKHDRFTSTGKVGQGRLYRGTSLIRNTPPPRTLQKVFTWDRMVVLGGGLFPS